MKITSILLSSIVALTIGITQVDAMDRLFINDDFAIEANILHNAVEQDSVALLQQALNEVTDAKSFLERALMTAAHRGKPGIVEYILQHYPEIDINAKSDVDKLTEGMTPLMHAVSKPVTISRNARKIVATPISTDTKQKMSIAKRILLCPNIHINAQDQDGQTALMHAIIDAYPQAVEQLLKYPGIDLNIRNDNGESALDLAREETCPPQITQIIKRHYARFNMTKSTNSRLVQ